jgi:hypothetical protein
MTIIDIYDIDDLDSARSYNPDAIIRLNISEGCFNLYFPIGHPVGKYVCRC